MRDVRGAVFQRRRCADCIVQGDTSDYVWRTPASSRFWRPLAFRGFYLVSGRPGFFRQVERRDAMYHGPRAALDRAVDERLSALLRHAFTTVPFYRELDAPPQERAAVRECLRRLPILTKEIIRTEGRRLLSESPSDEPRWNTSGGSTGEPIRVLQDRRMKRASTINKMLFMRWLGFEPGEPHLLIWGQPQATFGGDLSPRERIYRQIHNQTYLNCHQISEPVLATLASWIGEYGPSVIEAYADALADLSRFALAGRMRLKPPRGIITSQGVLTSRCAR